MPALGARRPRALRDGPQEAASMNRGSFVAGVLRARAATIWGLLGSLVCGNPQEPRIIWGCCLWIRGSCGVILTCDLGIKSPFSCHGHDPVMKTTCPKSSPLQFSAGKGRAACISECSPATGIGAFLQGIPGSGRACLTSLCLPVGAKHHRGGRSWCQEEVTSISPL